MNCGHQREGEVRLGYAERSRSNAIVRQPHHDPIGYERS